MDAVPTGTKAGKLSEQTLRRPRWDIITGRIPAGTMLSVSALSAETGMSTTPVREALLTLGRDGLAAPLRNRGLRVEAMSIAQLDHLFALRELLEG